MLTGMAMWLSAKFVPSSDDPAKRTRWYFDINALGLALAAGVAVGATALLAGRRPWDAAMFATRADVGARGDDQLGPVAVALLTLAMLAWAREKPAAAGVLIGLAAVTGSPLFLLGPLLVLCLRAGRMREFWTGSRRLPRLGSGQRAVHAGRLRRLVEVLPALAGARPASARSGSCSASRATRSATAHEPGCRRPVRVGLRGDRVLALVADRRPRLPQLAFLVVAAFLLTNKVYSPQYVLWLLPLAVLARPRGATS